MADTRWLRCEIHKGMFSDERAIRITMPHGLVLDAFVPSADVQADPRGGGRVRVQLISVADGCWVLLPAGNPTPIAVREMDLVA